MAEAKPAAPAPAPAPAPPAPPVATVASVATSATDKILNSSNLGAGAGTLALLAYYMFSALPAVELRHDAKLDDIRQNQKEALGSVTATLVEVNRAVSLLRDEMRDAHHDLEELRRVVRPAVVHPPENPITIPAKPVKPPT